MLAEKYGAYKAVNDPELSPLFSASTTTPLYIWTIPLELSESSGLRLAAELRRAVAVQAEDDARREREHLVDGADDDAGAVLFDYIIECWTLPDQVNKLTGLSSSRCSRPASGRGSSASTASAARCSTGRSRTPASSRRRRSRRR
jgi:hypothetical protein